MTYKKKGAIKQVNNTLDIIDSKYEYLVNIVNNVVYKNYLYELGDLDIIPISKEEQNLSSIRIMKVTEMIYQKDESITHKFAAVFNAVQHLRCTLFVIMSSDSVQTDFYIGIHSLEDSHKYSVHNLMEIVKRTLKGQFPGIKYENLLEPNIKDLLSKLEQQNNISAVSCIADTKIEEMKSNEEFIQGLEKLARAMQGSKYTAVIIAESIHSGELNSIRLNYENIYKTLSPLSSIQDSFAYNEVKTKSEAFSDGTSETQSYQKGSSKSFQASVIVAGYSYISTNSNSISSSTSKTQTETNSLSEGTTNTIMLTTENKTISNIMDKVDTHLKRLYECESIGMWKTAAYFTTESIEDVEVVASIYKSLMSGVDSNVEASAINVWHYHQKDKIKLLKEYITRFIHPKFMFNRETDSYVTASSIVSSNELAIHMGFPRKSLSGFPVIEHAEFAYDIIKHSHKYSDNTLKLGYITNMGEKTSVKAMLDIDSLTMHTFITGSTGSGKSNTIYNIVNSLMHAGIRVLVIEPAKGEYKNIFGYKKNVSVYGTNPYKTPLLKINPFKFNEDIHILEHLDRLIEIFNVCWPMYAAMPAILKEAIEKAYENLGWDLSLSTNQAGRIFPNFIDVLENIEKVVEVSTYSSDSKSDYSGALLTRVKSLTNGLNGQIFTNDDVSDEVLFDKNVIVDLSRIGSMETKALITGILVMKLSEHRMSQGRINSPLRHVTVLEEAHHLLKRTSTEQISESSNILGKSVEMIANSIAEMRTYGEGFIIADQSPSMIDMAAIRNTNTKIIMRLPDEIDRKTVGLSAGLNEDQIKELSKLPTGVAAVYQNNWIDAVLVSVDEFGLKDNIYNKKEDMLGVNIINIRNQLVNFLVSGRVINKPYFSLNNIKDNMHLLSIPSYLLLKFKNIINEYTHGNSVYIWRDEYFFELSLYIVKLLNIEKSIDDCVISASSNQNLFDRFINLFKEKNYIEDDIIVLKTISQCCMKYFVSQVNEKEKREQIYYNWQAHIRSEDK